MALFSTGRRGDIVRLLSVVVVLLAVVSCSGNKDKTRLYSLQTISDRSPARRGEATAYVQLRKGGSNVVTIEIRGKTGRSFRVYKQEGGQGEFKEKSALNLELSKSVQSWDSSRERLVTFSDRDNPSVNDRYRIVSITDGKESGSLRVIYETDDADYFRQVENKEPGK
jgi:hypothetical protein